MWELYRTVPAGSITLALVRRIGEAFQLFAAGSVTEVELLGRADEAFERAALRASAREAIERQLGTKEAPYG